jgi:uncharacterized Zn-finger protein
MENDAKPDLTTTVAEAPEIIYVKDRRIACDGGGGALGHPRVWYSLEDGEAACGYCDRQYIYDPSKAG